MNNQFKLNDIQSGKLISVESVKGSDSDLAALLSSILTRPKGI